MTQSYLNDLIYFLNKPSKSNQVPNWYILNTTNINDICDQEEMIFDDEISNRDSEINRALEELERVIEAEIEQKSLESNYNRAMEILKR